MKCFIEDRAETKKMALTLSYSRSKRTFKGIPCSKYRHNALFLGLGRNACLSHGFFTNSCGFDILKALNL